MLLDNARLHRRRLEQELVRRDLAQAREVQDLLLPAAFPAWPGRLALAVRYRPAQELSGDFYDVVPLVPPAAPRGGGYPAPVGGDTGDAGDEAPAPLQIAVGDVMGKGLAAALVMAVARNALRDAADRATPPASPGASDRGPHDGAAGAVRHDAVPGDDPAPGRPRPPPRRGPPGLRRLRPGRDRAPDPPGDRSPGRPGPRLRLANAAQVPPLLCRDGRAVELAPPGERLPLGILPDVDYEELLVDLEPGDAVVFTSDGVPEAPARADPPRAETDREHERERGPPRDGAATAGEFFGFERLAASASSWAGQTADAEGLASGVWADLTSWCGAAPHHDDMLLLVVRVPAAPPAAASLSTGGVIRSHTPSLAGGC